MADVKGVRVTPVRKPTMPESTSKLVLAAVRCIQPEIRDPMLAPALRAGAKTPPAAPVVKEKTGPTIRSKGIYQDEYLSPVNKAVVINSFPEPSTLSLTKKARVAISKAQPVT